MISEEMFRYRCRFGYFSGLVNWSAVSVKAIIESSLCFSYILSVTAFAMNHINKSFRVAGDVVSNRSQSCFACGMECVRGKLVGYVVTLKRVAAALKSLGGGGWCMLFCEGLRSLARTRELLRLLLRRKATKGADLNML